MNSNSMPAQPSGPAPRRHHRIRNTFIVIGGLLVLLIILGAALGGSGGSKIPVNPVTNYGAQVSDSPAPSSAAAPAHRAPTMVSQTDVVVFSVSGTGDPSIQYGDGATTNNPSGGAGPLSDGNYLPWHASMPYSADAEYYAVTAQLEGSGDISDTVTEVVTTQCSNGTHTESFPLANGSANGGYGIAQAEYASGDTGNAAQAESDAGC